MDLSATAFDDPANVLAEFRDTFTLQVLREYADTDVPEAQRAQFKERLMSDEAFYAAGVTALKQVADLLFYAAALDHDDEAPLVRLEKMFRASVNNDVSEFRRMRTFMLMHHRELQTGPNLSAHEQETFDRRIRTFLASYQERLQAVSNA